jgi:hypothetical protein
VRCIARPNSDIRKHLDFPELVNLVQSYIDEIYINKLEQHNIQLRKCIDFTCACASTNSSQPVVEMRRFAIGDKDYPSDSVVSDNICHDLMKMVDQYAKQDVDV